MDYIIFGIGASATLVLIGWLLRDWGPRIRDRQPPEDEILTASDMVTRMAWARFCAACGMALMLCGVLVMLVTFAAAFFSPSDSTASVAVLAAFGLVAILMLIWAGLYLRQFGAIGIHRPKPKPESVPEPLAVRETGDVAPSMAEPAVSGATAEPAPSFAEAAAARGGLGRFAAFIRRDTGDETASPAPETPTPETSAPHVPVSPTDAVIAELAGGEEKRLSENDPLVTSVRAAARVQPVVAPDDESAVESPLADRPAHEVALDTLRRRRLARLSQGPDTD